MSYAILVMRCINQLKMDKPPSKYKFKLVLQGERLSPEAAAAGAVVAADPSPACWAWCWGCT